MGRYDSRIKVYDNGQWKNVQRLRIKDYNSVGGWCDLGENEDFNNIDLKVLNNNSYVRVTRTRQDVTTVTERYTVGVDNGAFHLLPANGFNFCANASEYPAAANNAWEFRCTIRRTNNATKQVFNVRNSAGTHYLKIIWNENGTITVASKYSTERSFTSTNTCAASNTWYTLRVYKNKGTNNMYIVWNGVTTNSANVSSYYMQQQFLDSNQNTVGASGLEFKDTLYCQGTQPVGSSYTLCSLNTNLSNESDKGSLYTNTKLIPVSHTDTQWV